MQALQREALTQKSIPLMAAWSKVALVKLAICQTRCKFEQRNSPRTTPHHASRAKHRGPWLACDYRCLPASMFYGRKAAHPILLGTLARTKEEDGFPPSDPS